MVPGRRLNALPSVQTRMRIPLSGRRGAAPPRDVSLFPFLSFPAIRSPSPWLRGTERWERNCIPDEVAKNHSHSAAVRLTTSIVFVAIERIVFSWKDRSG